MRKRFKRRLEFETLLLLLLLLLLLDGVDHRNDHTALKCAGLFPRKPTKILKNLETPEPPTTFNCGDGSKSSGENPPHVEGIFWGIPMC